MVPRSLSRLLLQSTKRVVRETVQRYRLRIAVQRLLKLPRGRAPAPVLLRALRRAWRDEGYSASLAYLQEVARHAVAAEGPILECGSGLTTILLGVLAGRHGVVVHTVEHGAEWHRRVAEVLRTYGITGVRLHLAPLLDRGSFVWYDVPEDVWPDEFRLVVCDGPPGDTKGGRYGLLPLVGARLPPGSVVLLDDAARQSEIAVLRRWRGERQLRERVYEGPDWAYAVLTLGRR